jgi:hypothetical protein
MGHYDYIYNGYLFLKNIKTHIIYIMIHYLIYFLDNTKNNTISIKNTYKNRNDAIINIEKIAFDYVRELEGEKQARICKQEKTTEQILNDATLKDGLYIIKNGDTVTLYEKTSLLIQGRVWNGHQNDIIQIGVFGMIEYKNVESLMTKRYNTEIKNITNDNQQLSNQSPKCFGFLDELKKIMNETDGKFNLKVNQKQL